MSSSSSSCGLSGHSWAFLMGDYGQKTGEDFYICSKCGAIRLIAGKIVQYSVDLKSTFSMDKVICKK